MRKPTAVLRSLTLPVGLLTLLLAGPAHAFLLEGHEMIEAAAYRRLLRLELVPGTEVSGRVVLAALIQAGILLEPPCLEPNLTRPGCSPRSSLETPLGHWPSLVSGAADLILDRQLGANGQCQHFMAETSDGLSPIEQPLGASPGLAVAAYRRCTTVITTVFEGILRDPHEARRRLLGMYALMHAIQDSFSEAHVRRDERGRIVLLKSWTLIDWPIYFVRGMTSFAAPTHHAVNDGRDGEYLRDQQTPDGRPCRAIHQGYALPETCLTDRARAAVDAVFDLLVLTYRLRDQAARGGPPASLAIPENAALWRSYLATHVPSVAAAPEVQVLEVKWPPRPDVLLGVQGAWRSGGWSAGLWSARLFYGPAVPFVGALEGGASFRRSSTGGQGDSVGARIGLGLWLPLARRFSIGLTPVAFDVSCDTAFDHCATGWGAVLGHLLIPVGSFSWVSLQGPVWSWTQGSFADARLSLAFGWGHERRPPFVPPSGSALAAWAPPAPGEVQAFRRSRFTRLWFVDGSAGATSSNWFVGTGLGVRVDRDRWDRRSGLAPGIAFALHHGRTEGTPGRLLVLSPELWAYLAPSRLALVLEPARLRVGSLAGEAIGMDLAVRLSLVLDIGNIELAVGSPPLSYLSAARAHWAPVGLRVGLRFD
jgi:hypothetical protein